jgi:hypothetical protein
MRRDHDAHAADAEDPVDSILAGEEITLADTG